MVSVQYQPGGLPNQFWQPGQLLHSSYSELFSLPSPNVSPVPLPATSYLFQTRLHTSCLYPSSSTVKLEQPIGYGSFGVVWSVYNPRTRERAALKKIPNAFNSLLSSIRTFREIKMLCELDHENLLSATDFIHPAQVEEFNDVYLLTELMETDLHQVIVSTQALSEDHIKVFLYQILRGVKYLHSAGIIHRDIKPGNMLVNSNCRLRICDFGFARAVEPNQSTAMTLEVVTQFYRAPELLAGCRHYNTAIDMWSVGCVLAELLGRRILFEALNPMSQLKMITDLLGSPEPYEVHHLTSESVVKELLSQKKPSCLGQLYKLSSHTNHYTVHLLSQLLKFDPERRITCVDALYHPYLEEGRVRYHTYLCSCCYADTCGRHHYTPILEPSASFKFNQDYEREFGSLSTVKAHVYGYMCSYRAQLFPLCLDTTSEQYSRFMRCSPGPTLGSH